MKSATLSTPFLDSERAVRSVNFFNGRLLTADDMKREQEAEALHRKRFGRIFGEGVAHGLRVSIKPGAKPRSVEVEAGVAINAEGQTIALPESVEIALSQDTAVQQAKGGPAQLTDCEPPEGAVYVTGKGLYLLSIGPGMGLEGSVPVTGLSNPVLGGRVRCCGARHGVEGAVFRLTEINHLFTAAEISAEKTLRSVLARRLFAPEKALSFVSNPLASTDRQVERPLARLGLAEDARIRDSVPLAVLYWTAGSGLVFADNWCVRRSPSGTQGARGWPLQTGDARAAEAEAMWRQFQDHVESIADPAAAKATDHFTYLPPAGVLPADRTAKTTGFQGFDVARFFTGFLVRDPIYIEGARVEHLLRVALAHPPMDLQADGSRVIWVYHVRENGMDADAAPPKARPYVIFTTGQVPCMGEARFDVGRWDYASYA